MYTFGTRIFQVRRCFQISWLIRHSTFIPTGHAIERCSTPARTWHWVLHCRALNRQSIKSKPAHNIVHCWLSVAKRRRKLILLLKVKKFDEPKYTCVQETLRIQSNSNTHVAWLLLLWSNSVLSSYQVHDIKIFAVYFKTVLHCNIEDRGIWLIKQGGQVRQSQTRLCAWWMVKVGLVNQIGCLLFNFTPWKIKSTLCLLFLSSIHKDREIRSVC